MILGDYIWFLYRMFDAYCLVGWFLCLLSLLHYVVLGVCCFWGLAFDFVFGFVFRGLCCLFWLVFFVMLLNGVFVWVVGVGCWLHSLRLLVCVCCLRSVSLFWVVIWSCSWVGNRGCWDVSLRLWIWVTVVVLAVDLGFRICKIVLIW